MHLRAFAASIFLLPFPGIANAQTWISPDGCLSVSPPEVAKFLEVPMPPPPFVVLWMSDDETMRFGILKTEIPSNIKLIQSATEEGLANEIGGKVTRLPSKTLSGHEVWNMSAEGPSVDIFHTSSPHSVFHCQLV